MEQLTALEQQESQVASVTCHNHDHELRIGEELLQALFDGFNQIGPLTLTSKNEVQFAWLLLLARSTHSMLCSQRLMKTGYYSQALALLRTVTEDWLISEDCVKTPATLEALLHRKNDKLGGYKAMATRVGALEAYDDFDQQSVFVHSRPLSLRVLISPETHNLTTAPVYNKLLFLSCCESMLKYATKMLLLMSRVISQLVPDRLAGWKQRTAYPVDNAADWLTQIKAQYEDVGRLDAPTRDDPTGDSPSTS